MICQWYALCPNPATGVVEHPILAYVPTCQRCADKHDFVLHPGTFTPDGEGGYMFDGEVPMAG